MLTGDKILKTLMRGACSFLFLQPQRYKREKVFWFYFICYQLDFITYFWSKKFDFKKFTIIY